MLHQGQQQGQRHLYSSPHPAHCPRGEGAGRPAPERQRPRPPQRQGTTHPEPPPPLSLQRPPLRPPLLGRLLVRWPSPLRRVAGEPGCQYQQHGQQWRRWQQKKCCRFGRHPPPPPAGFLLLGVGAVPHTPASVPLPAASPPTPPAARRRRSLACRFRCERLGVNRAASSRMTRCWQHVTPLTDLYTYVPDRR